MICYSGRMSIQQVQVKQKIVPHLWFDKEAREAAEFYVSVFPDSKITNVTTLHDTPSGDCDVVSFNLNGFSFMSISAGPLFKINPSISFSVNLETAEEAEALWNKLSPGGEVLMEIGKYPWSEKYGWLNDKYGVSWQITPTKMDEMMKVGTPEQIKRVTEAFLKMKKFDLAELERAYKGE